MLVSVFRELSVCDVFGPPVLTLLGGRERLPIRARDRVSSVRTLSQVVGF